MKNIYKALAEFQQECPIIFKDTSGYGYTYADLPQIFKIINPLLKKHGLGFSQPIQGNTIKTIIFHIESGETIESETNIPQGVALNGMNDFQVLGSAITYLRRYALSSILGIISDKDTDAHGEQVKKQQKQAKKELSFDMLSKIIDRLISGEKITLKQIEAHYTLTDEQVDVLTQNGAI